MELGDVALELNLDRSVVCDMVDRGQLEAHAGRVRRAELQRYLREWGQLMQATRGGRR